MYMIIINGESTLALYKDKSLAEAFVINYEDWYISELIRLEDIMRDLFDTYNFIYGCCTHEEIFQYLVDTNYFENDDIELYENTVIQIEKHKENKIKLSYLEV